MTTEAKIVLVVCYMISGAIVYSRNYGLNTLVRQILTWIPVIGIIHYTFLGKNLIDNSFTFGIVTGPIVVGLLYELFDVICWKLNKRPFYLHAVGAKEMKGLGFIRDNNHYKWIDMFFSVVLILVWIGWPMLFVVVIHLTK
jgi:hypothetical protein